MAEWIDPYERIAHLEEALERAEAALTKALGQRDAVALTADRMTSYARQFEKALAETQAMLRDHGLATDDTERRHSER